MIMITKLGWEEKSKKSKKSANQTKAVGGKYAQVKTRGETHSRENHKLTNRYIYSYSQQILSDTECPIYSV